MTACYKMVNMLCLCLEDITKEGMFVWEKGLLKVLIFNIFQKFQYFIQQLFSKILLLDSILLDILAQSLVHIQQNLLTMSQKFLQIGLSSSEKT